MRGVSYGYYISSMSFQFEKYQKKLAQGYNWKSTRISVVSLRFSVPWFIV